MVNFGDVGRICLNQEIRGVCENCLWWEWDSGQQRCSNSCYHVCPLYRKRLFDATAVERGAPEPLAHGLGSQAAAQKIRLPHRQGEPVAGDAPQGDLQTFRQRDAVSGGDIERFYALSGPQDHILPVFLSRSMPYMTRPPGPAQHLPPPAGFSPRRWWAPPPPAPDAPPDPAPGGGRSPARPPGPRPGARLSCASAAARMGTSRKLNSPVR